jgi:RadC-like JAB domain
MWTTAPPRSLETFERHVHFNSGILGTLHNPELRNTTYAKLRITGDPTPSKEEIKITRRLKEAAEIFGLRFLDHLVIMFFGIQNIASCILSQ